MENGQNQNQETPPVVEDAADMDSLEATTTIVEGEGGAPSSGGAETPPPDDGKKKKKKSPIKGIAAKFNIYLLLFVFLLVIAGVVTVISIIRGKQVSNQGKTTVKTEPLSQEALDQLRQTDVKVGDPKQVLSVESNAVFSGQVLVRGGLEVAGVIKAGSPLTLPGVTVSGSSILNQVQASILQVTGNTTIQGQLAVQNNLTVNGSGSFAGALTAAKLNIQDLQINGDLQFTKHIDAGGGTPSKSDGSALGSGGTTSISGTDTAGTVAINTGGGTSPGCFATVTFSQKFNGTPHVVVTPIGAAGGSVDFYVTRTGSNFSICTSNAAPAGQSFAFDYIVID